jgi:cytochrome c peroxidase
MKKTSVIFFFGLLLFIASCKKDQIIQEPVGSSATPLAFPQPENLPKVNMPADNPLTVEGVKLGRHLFFDERLSGDNTQACASCHLQENNFADPRQFSIGIDGSVGNRNAMPIMNLAWQDFFFWNGRSSSLEIQALEPVENPIEMNTTWPEVIEKLEADPRYIAMFEEAFGPGPITKEKAAKAIAQYERTLVSSNAKFDKWQRGEATFTQLEEDGYELFNSEQGDCFHCHGDANTGNLFGSFGDLQFSNNGLDSVLTPMTGYEVVTGDTNDRGKFKVPSLRNIEYSFPYMHDGRFNTLQEVIEHYNMGGHLTYTLDPNMKAAGIGRNWTQYQKDALIAFMKTLSDDQFLTDTTFTNPW